MPTEYYSPISGGAISTVIMEVSRELIERGHRVSVLTILNSDETYAVGDVIPIESSNRDDLNSFQRLVSRVRGRLSKFDWPCFDYYLRSFTRQLALLSPAPDAVVLFNDLASSKYVKRAVPGAKVIVWLHNEWRTRHDIAEVTRNTDSFLTCSDYIRQWTSRAHGIALERFAVAHNGVDISTFRPRDDYQVSGDRIRVLFLGRIDPNKGPDLVADAVATLRAEGLPVDLTVAGGLWFYGHGNEMDDPFFRNLKTKMDSAGATYLGHVTRKDVPAMIRAHDVACVLSRAKEPFGLVALEAMASGCAVVASNRGGLPEACGNAASLVDPDDFQAVVGALRSLVADKELMQRSKQRSLDWAARNSWAECASAVENAAGCSVSGNGSRQFSQTLTPAYQV